MRCQNKVGRWRQCPGCGRERRLAPGRAVMCGHNRWDSATWSMVPCEGSGQPARQLAPAGSTGAQIPASRVPPTGDGRAA